MTNYATNTLFNTVNEHVDRLREKVAVGHFQNSRQIFP